MAVVDDDPSTRLLLRRMLESAGHDVVDFATAGDLLAHDLGETFVACVDLGLDDMPGLEVIRHLQNRAADLPVIVVTAHRELETAVEAMRAGAYDFVTKPFDADRLLPAIARAKERCALARRVRRLETALDSRRGLPDLIGQTPPMLELVRHVGRVADNDVTVCITGESGTGKEVVARSIHVRSPRHRGPFIALNCAAIPATLQESELFGHERGAFTGAVQQHRGRFEQAHGGTLFLDEVGEMSLATQASLLRAIQERTIRRVGGTTDIGVDVRIVCATHRNLRAEVDRGTFREDLYFRLVVYPIGIPPLRARTDDIPLIAAHFLRRLASDNGRKAPRIAPDALEALTRHPWPGNVRELQNVLQRALLSAEGPDIRLADLPPEVREASPPATTESRPTLRAGPTPVARTDEVLPLAEVERRAIVHALRATKGNIGLAAKLLQVGRSTLYRRLAALEIDFEASSR